MNVKNKIRLGTVFLFLLVIAAGGTGIYYLIKQRVQTNNILKANYESLEYAHAMQIALDSIGGKKLQYIDTLKLYLRLQLSNMTEEGERQATEQLQRSITDLTDGNTSAANSIRQHLQTIIRLNMKAIQNKSALSEAAAEQAVTFIITIVAVILVIGFTFIVNFPSVITDPINRLIEAIREIGQKNYQHRIHIHSKDEFAMLASSFNNMAERLEFFENSNLNTILFEKARAEAVINSLRDASIGIEKSGKVLFANDEALHLLGLASKDIVGTYANEISGRNDLFRFLLEEKNSAPFKIVVDSRENYFTKELIEVGDSNGGSLVIVIKNITSFKELDVAKTNFIATISHELKTPLASSGFSLKLLDDPRIGNLSTEQKELVETLKADNQRMLKILSELLNLSQVEAGKIKLSMEITDPYEIVHTSVAALKSSSREKEIRLELLLDKELPGIHADKEKTVWVLNNFLTNAIRYSPVGSNVLIRAFKEEGQVVISVTDFGQGIEQTYLLRVFERYFQVPGQTDSKGSGVGLAICKDIIEAMGGKVKAESTYGKGSTFSFSLRTG